VAQLVESAFGEGEVVGSNPAGYISTIFFPFFLLWLLAPSRSDIYTPRALGPDLLSIPPGLLFAPLFLFF
jgi:hypothetical protein